MAVAAVGCGHQTVVSGDLGNSALSASLELRWGLGRIADSFFVRSDYMSGSGTATVYGISGDVDYRASNVLVLTGLEWGPLGRQAGDGGVMLSVALPLGWQEVEYEDPGSGTAGVGSDLHMLGIGLGVSVLLPVKAGSALHASYHAGVIDEAMSDISLDYRFAATERITFTAGWRWLRMATISDKSFPTGSSGTQVVETESSGFVAGVVVSF